MARPRLLIGLLAAGSAAAAVVLRRRSGRSKARVELYFEDGSVATIESGAPGSDRLLALAREAVSAARPAP
jgi:hypothetical protein